MCVRVCLVQRGRLCVYVYVCLVKRQCFVPTCSVRDRGTLVCDISTQLTDSLDQSINHSFSPHISLSFFRAALHIQSVSVEQHRDVLERPCAAAALAGLLHFSAVTSESTGLGKYQLALYDPGR